MEIFLLVVLVALAMGFQQPDALMRGLLIAAGALYLLGVQLPTSGVR